MPLLCRTLEVSPSAYYTWLKRPDSPRQKEEARLVIGTKAAHKRNWETYWPERLLINELVHHRRYATRREAIQEITEYIEII